MDSSAINDELKLIIRGISSYIAIPCMYSAIMERGALVEGIDNSLKVRLEIRVNFGFLFMKMFTGLLVDIRE